MRKISQLVKPAQLLLLTTPILPASAIGAEDFGASPPEFPMILAAADIRQAEERSPLIQMLLEKARYWKAQNHAELAAENWRRVLMSNPRQPEALSELALYYAYVDRTDEAKKLLADLKKIDGRHPAVFQLEKLLFGTSESVDTATSGMNPEYFKAIAAGNKARKEMRLADAIAQYRSAAQLAPNRPEAHLAIGDISLERGDIALAEQSYRAALKATPNHPDATLGLAKVLLKQQRYNEAQSLAAQLEAKPVNAARSIDLRAEINLRLGEEAEKSGNTTAAQDYYNKAKSLRPDDPWVVLSWARFNLSEGKAAEAETEMRSLISRSSSVDAKFAASVFFAELKKLDEALSTLDQIPENERTDDIRRFREDVIKRQANGGGITTAKTPEEIQAEAEKEKRAQKVASLKSAAYKAYEEQDYKQSRELQIELESLGETGRDLDILRGWTEYNLGNNEESGTRFSKLYQEMPDKSSAQGLYYSYLKQHRTHELTSMAREETLKQLLEKTEDLGNAQADLRDPIAARQTDRERYAPFNMLGLSVGDVGGSFRSHSGDEGTARLTTRIVPELGYGWRSEDNTTDYRIQIDRVYLTSGVLDPLAVATPPVGTDALYGGNAAPLAQRTQMTGYEPTFVARHDTADATYIGEVGLTPNGGAVESSTLIGRLGLAKYLSWGEAGVEIYRQPVRETILSYTGMADPYTAAPPWGRVTRTGISPSARWRLDSKWSITSSMATEWLEGENTANNEHFNANLGASLAIGAKNFEYLTLAVNGTYNHYTNNQNLYTYGNGGYYSPQSAIAIGPSLNFLTRTFYPMTLGGYAAVTNARASSSDAQRFPLDPANVNNAVAPGATFYSSNSNGTNFNFLLQGLWDYDKRLQLGWALGYNKSNSAAPPFTERYVNLFARIPMLQGR